MDIVELGRQYTELVLDFGAVNFAGRKNDIAKQVRNCVQCSVELLSKSGKQAPMMT